MSLKEIRELIEFLIGKDISEFELERGDMRLRIKRGPAWAATSPAAASAAVPAPPPVGVTAPAPSPPTHPIGVAVTEESEGEEAGLHVLRSPIVGTFYESASPGAPAFVAVGDTVTTGQLLCIVEAMKLMNEIECDVSGTIIKRYVENGQPVEYAQPLFAIRVGGQ